MVALMFPPEQAATLVVDGGLPAEDLHVTLGYLGKVPDIDNQPAVLSTLLDVVSAVAAKHPPVTGILGGLARFTGQEGQPDAFVMLFDSPGLDWLRGQLVAAMLEADLPVSLQHGFTAHSTLTYLQQSDPAPMDRLEPVPATFDAVTVCWGDTHVAVPFGVVPELAEQAVQPEEIADPRTWAELRTAQSLAGVTDGGQRKAGFFTESAHPRGPGGKFADKPDQAGAGPVLPPDWLDRLLAGDASFVKPKGGGKGKGKGKAKKSTAASAAARAARTARTERARQRRDRETLAELTRRNAFDEAMNREKDAETDRQAAAAERISLEIDSTRQAAMKAEESARRKAWTSQQAKTRRDETTRRRQWELDRRTRLVQEAVTEAATRRKEQQAIDQAAGAANGKG